MSDGRSGQTEGRDTRSKVSPPLVLGVGWGCGACIENDLLTQTWYVLDMLVGVWGSSNRVKKRLVTGE